MHRQEPDPPPGASVRPKKHLGQHFLTDRRIAQRIAALADPQPGERVVEIGPGTGVLTAELLRRGLAVTAIEYDPESVAYLHQHYASAPLTVIGGDVLAYDLGASPTVLVGNLPYNLSSPILFHALEHRQHVRQLVFMVQREVAQRWAAPEGSRTYGILSVLAGYYYRAELHFTVPPGVFRPPPKVTSAVITFERREGVPAVDFGRFKALVKAAFNQRRKTLGNALKGFPVNLPPALAGLRAEQLSPTAFAELAAQP